MSTVSMTGADTIKINNRIFADLADGDCVVLAFPNEKATLKTGKNGNTIYALNESGKQAEITLRLVRGSSDDKFMSGLFAQQENDFASFTLMIGEFVKRIGTGQGGVIADTYVLSGGIFSKHIEAKSNVEGDTEQSISIYNLKFAKAARVIG